MFYYGRSVKLVEQELWQREEKGLIGILPVRDDADAPAIVPVLSQGSQVADSFMNHVGLGGCILVGNHIV